MPIKANSKDEQAKLEQRFKNLMAPSDSELKQRFKKLTEGDSYVKPNRWVSSNQIVAGKQLLEAEKNLRSAEKDYSTYSRVAKFTSIRPSFIDHYNKVKVVAPEKLVKAKNDLENAKTLLQKNSEKFVALVKQSGVPVKELMVPNESLIVQVTRLRNSGYPDLKYKDLAQMREVARQGVQLRQKVQERQNTYNSLEGQAKQFVNSRHAGTQLHYEREHSKAEAVATVAKKKYDTAENTTEPPEEPSRFRFR